MEEYNISDDDSDVEVCVENDEICTMPGNLSFICKENCTADAESWTVDDSLDSDVDYQLYSMYLEVNDKNNLLEIDSSETVRNVLKAVRKCKKSDLGDFKIQSTKEENTEVVDTEKYFNLPAAKKVKYSANVNSELSTINEPSCSKDLPRSSDLSSRPCLSDLLSASCSKSLPGSSSGLRYNADSSVYDSMSEAGTDTRLSIDMYHKQFLEECAKSAVVPEKVIENVGGLPKDNNDDILTLYRAMTIKDDDENLQIEKCGDFVEDPDIVNPDIMYNIDLNEHYKLMDILVQKITETPDDLTVFDECMQLPPIPQVEHEPKVFTEEERLMFFNGISRYEYEIDRDDWNKIMVKRAVIFTAHAGFNIANEESLYVLAELAIDYIKNLAVVMKHNFDIQSQCSQPGRIDPINVSLQDIGIQGGVKEVIDHYGTDIFGRRDKLMKKCQHLQKVIDQYIERMQMENVLDHPCLTKEVFEAENSTNEVILENQENVPLQEIDVKTELPTEEVNTEVQSIIEEIQMESQLVLEEDAYSSTEFEQTEPIFFDDTTEIELSMDITSKGIESINTDAMEPIDRKINDTRIIDPKITNFDLLKPIPKNIENEPILGGQINREEFLAKWEPSFKESFSERKKKGNLLDRDAVNRLMAIVCPNEIQQPIKLDEFDKSLLSYKTSPDESTKLSSDTVLTQTDENMDTPIPMQPVIVSDNSHKVETSSMNNTHT